MVEHTVVVDIIGGGMILSCETLQIKNIEYPYPKLTKEGVKDTITHYKHFSQSDIDTISIVVVNNTPEKEENYNDVKERESKEFRKNRNDMFTSKI